MKIKNLFYLIINKFRKINPNQWFFISHNGCYSDNTKALSEYIHSKYPEIKIVWTLAEEKTQSVPEYIKCAIGKAETEYEKSKSKVIIDVLYGENVDTLFYNDKINNFLKRLKLFLKKKNNQKIYSLWHGTPLKRMGRDQIGNDDIKNFISNNVTMISGNKYTSDIMESITFGSMNYQVLGMARNDVLFSNENINEIKKKLNLPADKKIVLFAPTFRNDGKDVEGKNVLRSGISQINEIKINDLLNALSQKFGGEWVLVCRLHYHITPLIDWDELNTLYSGKIINGNISDDMADHLCCTDVLITDYSSSMFDFALTGKPCFLYTPDLEHYQNKERGFYIPVESLPFSYSLDSEGLIKNILKHDSFTYSQNINSLLEKMGNVDDGRACERIAEYIYNENLLN